VGHVAGKVEHLIFNDSFRVTHRILSGFLGALLALPPAKQLMARQQVRSIFVNAMLGGARARAAQATASS